MRSLNESKQGFWGALARKAKSIIEDEQATPQSKAPERMGPQMPGAASSDKVSLDYISISGVEHCRLICILWPRKEKINVSNRMFTFSRFYKGAK